MISDRSPYRNAVKITPGTKVPEGRGILILATVAGTQQIKFAGGAIVPLPVEIGTNIWDDFAVVDAPVGGSAVADVWVLN